MCTRLKQRTTWLIRRRCRSGLILLVGLLSNVLQYNEVRRFVAGKGDRHVVSLLFPCALFCLCHFCCISLRHFSVMFLFVNRSEESMKFWW